MTENIIQLIVGTIITICTIVFLCLSKTITWQQLKDIFSPEEICGVKLYRLSGTQHVWDEKFHFLYCLPILTTIVALLLELLSLLSMFWFGYQELTYAISLGVVDISNFLSLLCVADRKRLIEYKLSEPSWEDLKVMTDSELQQTLRTYKSIRKNSSYALFIIHSRPNFDISLFK